MFQLTAREISAIAFVVLLIGSLQISFVTTSWAKNYKIVVLGDSLTAGYQLPRNHSFPSQLEIKLRRSGKSISVINAGVSGDTSSAGLARLDWAVPSDTKAVIVELGANDALRGISPQQTYQNLDKILTRLKEKGVTVLLTGMEAPRNLGDKYVEEFRSIYQSLAAKHEVILYPFFLEGVALNSEFLLSDGIHPNKEGVLKIVENIYPYVEKLISQLEKN